MATTVVNIKTGAQFDVYIGRASNGVRVPSLYLLGYFGNPFRIRAGQPRGSTLDKFRTYFYDRLTTDAEFKARVLQLKDKRLGCFCHPQPCHGDIIAEYLDRQ